MDNIELINENNSLMIQLEYKDAEIKRLEDQISTLETKLSTHSNIPSSEEYEALKNRNSSLQKTIESLSKELLEVKDDQHIKKHDLAFANDIASAKIDKAFDPEILSRIDKIRNFVISDYTEAFLKYNLYINAEFVRKQIDAWRNVQSKTWINDKTVIAFIGHFSSGKTTYINKILRWKDNNSIQLPVALDPNTAIPTYITGCSKGLRTSYCDYSGNLRAIAPRYLEEITKEQLQRVKVSSMIKAFVVPCPNEYLEGISILDTPGYDSDDAVDRNRTDDALLEADVLIWVVSAADGGIKETSKKVLDSLKSANLPLYVVLTWCDKKTESGLIDIEKSITEELNSIDIHVIKIFRSSLNSSPEEFISMVSHSPKREDKDSILIDIYFDILNNINKVSDELKMQKESCNKKEDDMNNHSLSIRGKYRDICTSTRRIDSLTSSRRFHSDLIIKSKDIQDFNDGLDGINQAAKSLHNQANELMTLSSESSCIKLNIAALEERDYSLRKLKANYEAFLQVWNRNKLIEIKKEVNDKL